MMRQHGDIFAAAGAVSDVVEICGQSYGSPRSYDSAHRAAVGEARHLLLGLWIHLDPAGDIQSIMEFPIDAGTLTAATAASTKPSESAVPDSNPTNLTRRRFYERWGEARAEILLRLSNAWERDFRTIPTQIKSERQLFTKMHGQGDKK